MTKACCGAQEQCCPRDQAPNQVALLGNPNAGKTTLFNLLTGARQRTGNWPGVTVERKSGRCRLEEQDLDVVDLPGTYSLDFGNTSTDEKIARDFVQQHPGVLYLNILDASTLERGLYLTLQLRELNVPMILILNMMDIAERRGKAVDVRKLRDLLGCPVVPVSLRQPGALKKIHRAICHYAAADMQNFSIAYHETIEHSLQQLQQQRGLDRPAALLTLQSPQADAELLSMREQAEQAATEEFDFLLADARFDTATQVASSVSHERGKISRTLSDRFDHWVIGSWTGIPFFLVMMYLLFFFSINLGGAFIDFFDISAQTLFIDGPRHLLESWHLPEWFITFFADGLGGGLQIVATFIPVIGALYLFLTLLEESGYMARAAFVMDQFMRKLGISGKAFVPLIVGFGCNVPSIMATRTLDSQRERTIAVLMAPFMSCGARLAVYALFAAAFFKTSGHNIVFLLYLTGIAFAILTALIMRKTLLRGSAGHFVMEMPTYQLPQVRNVLINTWSKLKGFVLGAGKIIIIMVAIINVMNSVGTDGSFGNQDSEKSVLSATARAITPAFAPMGIEQNNWPATVGIISGLLAKEVVVGTLDTLYGNIDRISASSIASAKEAQPFSLARGFGEAAATIPVNLSEVANSLLDPLGLGALDENQDINKSTYTAMQARFDGAIGAFAYLLFILMYFPCVAATGAMYREVGARWTMLGVAWSTGLGFGVAVLFYQLATLAKHPTQSAIWTGLVLIAFTLTLLAFYRAGRGEHRQPHPLALKGKLT